MNVAQSPFSAVISSVRAPTGSGTTQSRFQTFW